MTHGSSYQVQLDVLHEDLLVEFVFPKEHVGRCMRLSISKVGVGRLIDEYIYTSE
jgi:hypothetical protein